MKQPFLFSRPLLLIAIAVITLTASAKEQFLPGYIVSSKGDTTHGFIDYRNWDRNPLKILFKTDLNELATEYTPANIHNFSVAGLQYKAATVSTELSSSFTGDLEHDPALRLVRETAFIEALIVGEKSLYHYKNSQNKDQFYIVNDDTLALLVYKKYLKEIGANTVVMENKKFLGQLILYLEKCPEIQLDIQSAKYRKKSLVNLFNQYNQCTNNHVTFKRKAKKAAIDIGVFVGATITQFNINSSSRTYLDQTQYPSSTRFTTGFFMDFDLSKTKKRWSVNTELMIYSYKTSGSHTDFVSDQHYTIRTTDFRFSYFKINAMIRYRYPIKKITVFANLGVSAGKIMMATNNMTTETIKYSYHDIKYEDAIPKLRSFVGGTLFGVGAKYKHFLFEARYEMGGDVASYADVVTNTRVMAFLLSYRF